MSYQDAMLRTVSITYNGSFGIPVPVPRSTGGVQNQGHRVEVTGLIGHLQGMMNLRLTGAFNAGFLLG